jgi:hypothetical protein
MMTKKKLTEWESDVVAHAEELTEANDLVRGGNAVFFHPVTRYMHHTYSSVTINRGYILQAL